MFCRFLFFTSAAFALASGLEEIGRLGTADSLPGAEISAYIASEKMLAVTSGQNSLSLVSLKEASAPKLLRVLDFPHEIPSVAAHGNLLAILEKGETSSKPGTVHLYEINGETPFKRKSLPVCEGPDMVSFSPDGKTLLLACEGEPDSQNGKDPEGAIGLVDLSSGVSRASFQALDFFAFDSASLVQKGVRVAGPGSFRQNLEPEYISFSPDGRFAFASLQENNAVAKIDVHQKKIVTVWALGTVDHSLPGNEFDFQDNGIIALENAPIRGELQPDGICAFESNGKLYILTADEGASRDFASYSDETIAKHLKSAGLLDSSVFSTGLLRRLGKLPIDAENPCDRKFPCRYLNTFGGRSISLFDGNTGARIWNSGNIFEKTLAEKHPNRFNWNAKKEKIKIDSRSDKKGPEPEGVTTGKTANGTFAFVAVERASGIAVFDLKNPQKPEFREYVAGTVDRGPEGVLFIPAEISPLSGIPLLIVGYEYSQTLVIYRVFY